MSYIMIVFVSKYLWRDGVRFIDIDLYCWQSLLQLHFIIVHVAILTIKTNLVSLMAS